MFRVEVEVVPIANKCGEAIAARVKLTNKTTKPWSGVVNLSAGAMKSQAVSLAKDGPDATKTVDIALTAKLECNKPLVPHKVRIWNGSDETDTLFAKSLKPTKITAERGFPAPPSTDTRPWLRRVVLGGTCGGAVSPVVHLHAFGGQPQSANVKLTFGAVAKEQAVDVLNTTPVSLAVPGALDCQAATGIPAFEFALLNGNTASGKLDPAEVTFEP